MFCSNRSIIPAFTVIASLLVAPSVRAVAPEIKDDGKFFSAEAVKKANKEIREIERKFGMDLLIETFAGVPGDQAAKVKAMSAEERAKFFRNWSVDRAEAAVVNGVYIMVVKDPPRLEIEITPKARAALNNDAFEKLRSGLLKKFRDKHFDEGLAEAVSFVKERFAAVESK